MAKKKEKFMPEVEQDDSYCKVPTVWLRTLAAISKKVEDQITNGDKNLDVNQLVGFANSAETVIKCNIIK